MTIATIKHYCKRHPEHDAAPPPPHLQAKTTVESNYKKLLSRWHICEVSEFWATIELLIEILMS